MAFAAKRAALASTLLLLASCKHHPQNTAEVLAATPLGPNNEVDLTAYTAGGEECPPWSLDQSGNERKWAAIQDTPAYRDPTLPYQKIPKEELVAIRNYSLSDYVAQNNALRFQDIMRLKQLEPAIRCTASGLNKMPPYVGVVSRSATLRPSDLQPYVVGQTVVMRNFLSTTSGDIDRDLPLAIFCGNVVYHINSLQGRSIAWMSATAGEAEVLFPPGSEFRTDAVETQQQPSPDIIRARCAAKYPTRTLIKMTQVASGTYAKEHPGEQINFDPSGINTADDVINRLNDPSITTARGRQITRYYFERLVHAASDSPALDQALSDMQALCRRDARHTAYFADEVHLPECQVKTVTIFAPIEFHRLPLAANSTVSFYPNGAIEQALLSQATQVDGRSAVNNISFYDTGHIHTYFDNSGRALTVFGQVLTPNSSEPITLDESGEVRQIRLKSGSTPYSFKGKSYSGYVSLADDGSVIEGW